MVVGGSGGDRWVDTLSSVQLFAGLGFVWAKSNGRWDWRQPPELKPISCLVPVPQLPSCLVPLEAALLKWALQSWDLPGGWLLLRKRRDTHLADLSSICRLSAKDWMHPRCPGAITKHRVPHFWAAFSPNYSIQDRYVASQAGFRQALLFQWAESAEGHIFSRMRVFTAKSTEPGLATSLLCGLDRVTSLGDCTNLCTD